MVTSTQEPSGGSVSLPVLPHPSSLITPGAPAEFLIAESRRSYEQLSQLRKQILSGQGDAFEIDPPGPSSLPPLPPIPQPPTTHHRRQSLQSPVRAPRRPISRPPVPSSHPLCKVETPSEAVQAYNGIGKGKAVLRHDNSAVYVDMGDGQGAAWILLDSLNDGGMRVESVKLYTGGEASESLPIHSTSSSIPLRKLGSFVTGLHLTIQELLYRLVHLPEILDQPCVFCSTRFKVPDGLPVGGNGWLVENGGRAESPVDRQAIAQNERTGGEPKTGLWVSWHTSCEPDT